jgi:hypothetical protein
MALTLRAIPSLAQGAITVRAAATAVTSVRDGKAPLRTPRQVEDPAYSGAAAWLTFPLTPNGGVNGDGSRNPLSCLVKARYNCGKLAKTPNRDLDVNITTKGYFFITDF